MRFPRPLILLVAGLAAACNAAEEPYVLIPPLVGVGKPKDPVLKYGYLSVCHSDNTPWDEVVALGKERCGAHGLGVWYGATSRWQCTGTSPHITVFYCFDPEMRDERGRYINPFNKLAVSRWEKRTGKTAKPHNFMTGAEEPGTAAAAEEMPEYVPGPPEPPTAPVSQVMPPAPVAPTVKPLSPADIAGKPPIPPPPVLDAPPPRAPVPLPGEDGFRLPQGSWGDHFEE